MAAPVQAKAPAPVDVRQLSLMPYQQRQALLAAQPAEVQGAWARYLHTSNARFLQDSFRKEAQCVMSNGGATTQNYSSGTALYFTAPTINAAYVEAIRVYCTLTVTPTSTGGTTATYAVNACGPLGLFSNVKVQMGNSQWDVNPSFLQDLAVLGRKRASKIPVVANEGGYTDATLQTWRGSTTFPVAVGANTWDYYFDIPLKLIHKLDPRGMLPLYAQGIPVQVILTCNPSIMGPDPELNAVANTNAGVGGVSGTGVGVTGTIGMNVIYRDGISPTASNALPLYLAGMGTMQFMRDQDLPQLSANQLQMQRILKASRAHQWVISHVIDGNQSASYATLTNFAELVMSIDSAGVNPLMKYGGDTNVSPMSWFNWISEQLESDALVEGVVPWIAAPIYNTVNPDNHEGTMVLDNAAPAQGVPAGHPNIYYGAKMTSVGSVTGITPRIVTAVAFLNEQGFQIQGLS